MPSDLHFRESSRLCAWLFTPARGWPTISSLGVVGMFFSLLSSIRILSLEWRKVGNMPVNVRVGNELFWYIFKGGAAAETG
jgi:hypothetical protein